MSGRKCGGSSRAEPSWLEWHQRRLAREEEECRTGRRGCPRGAPGLCEPQVFRASSREFEVATTRRLMAISIARSVVANLRGKPG